MAVSVSGATVTDVVAGNASAAADAAGCPLVGAALNSSPNATEIVVSGGAALHCVGTCVGLLIAGTSFFPSVIDVAESSLFQCKFALPFILWFNNSALSPSAASSSRVTLTNTTAFARANVTLAAVVLAPVAPTMAGPYGGDMIQLCRSRTASMTKLTSTLSRAETTERASTTLPAPRSPSRTGSISNSGDFDDDVPPTSRTGAASSTRAGDDGSTSLTADRGTLPELTTAWSVTSTSSLAPLYPRSAAASRTSSRAVIAWSVTSPHSRSPSRIGHAPRAAPSQTATTTHERSLTPLHVAATAAPTLLSPSAAHAVSGAANGAAAVVSIVGAMPGVAAQAAMAQAAITMAECTDTVPETPLTFPQSLAPGFSIGPPRAGHYRGAMVASVASLFIGGSLLLAVGYVLQRVRPQMAEGETGVFLRSLTAVMAPGTMFTIVAFNVDPVVGAATALLQVGEDYPVDAPVAVCGTALFAICVFYVWRAARLATDPRNAARCLRFDPTARVVPPFRRPPFGLSCLTPDVLRWCFYGTGVG
jgi:hypothetical protein